MQIVAILLLCLVYGGFGRRVRPQMQSHGRGREHARSALDPLKAAAVLLSDPAPPEAAFRPVSPGLRLSASRSADARSFAVTGGDQAFVKGEAHRARFSTVDVSLHGPPRARVLRMDTETPQRGEPGYKRAKIARFFRRIFRPAEVAGEDAAAKAKAEKDARRKEYLQRASQNVDLEVKRLLEIRRLAGPRAKVAADAKAAGHTNSTAAAKAVAEVKLAKAAADAEAAAKAAADANAAEEAKAAAEQAKAAARVEAKAAPKAESLANDKVDVVVVGCGVPKRGMGWYHAIQLLQGEVPSARLKAVVEPWFLGDGAESPAGADFKKWADETSKHEVGFYKSVADLPRIKSKTLALISGRTADNPRLLKEVIEAGCTHVFLEKPGAPTVSELEDMKEYAERKGVPVYMGYNKNVASYVLDALEAQKKTEGASVTFIHNNAYKEAELPECFERNAEGMLKNMAIHELALLATYFGVTVDNIADVAVDKGYSRCLTLTGPQGSDFTDFAKIGFTVKTKEGNTVTVKADRCGSDEGGNSVALVTTQNADGLKRLHASTLTPDAELKKICDEKAVKDPDMMPYFFLQSDDYVTLKERSTSHILSGNVGAPEGMATLEIGIEALKVAEYLTPKLQEAVR